MSEPRPSEQVARYLANRPDLPPIWEPPLAARRLERKEQVLRDSGPPAPVHSAQDIDANGARARLYHPAGGEENVLIWIHGGGWVLHDIDTFDALVRRLAHASACAVLAVEYRRAPEDPFPAAVEDCWAVTQWARDHFTQTGVGGDSAGANLAAVTAIRARDAALTIAIQVLVYPLVDYAVETADYHEHRQRYELFAGVEGYGADYHDSIRWLWSQYIPDAEARVNVEAAPIRASSLAGVAPALVVTAEHDILRREGLAYTQRLAADGVSVESIDYVGQVHGFLEALSLFDDADDAIRRIGAAVRNRFAISANEEHIHAPSRWGGHSR
jgi:acetyl esterase